MRVAPALTGQAIITFAGRDRGTVLNGVVPDLMKNVSTIDEHFLVGSLDALAVDPNGILIGSGLADKFRARLSDNLTVTSPVGVVRTMKIVGLFHTGTASYDAGQTFVLLKRAQSLLKRPNVANRFIVQLQDPARAPAVARIIEDRIGYKAQSWQEANQDLMSLVKIRNTIMYSVPSSCIKIRANRQEMA